MRSAALIVTLGSLARAAVTPTSPGGGTEIFNAGQECSFTWRMDDTQEWKSFDVDLFTGSNFEMINVTRVAMGLDGTNASRTNYSFPCPEVDPPAPIYFYQFTSDGQDPMWTQRFSIAAPNGTLVEAENALQPNGAPVPWGVGSLVNKSSEAGAPESGSIASQVWGLVSSGTAVDSTSIIESAAASDGQWTPSSTVSTGWWPEPSATEAGTIQLTDSPTNSTNITGFQQYQVCDKDNLCPEDMPCCSEYGFCGTGRNCLAGCNPFASFEPQLCAPVPACIDQEYSLQTWSASRILRNSSAWNGDATSIDWLVDSIGNTTLGPLTANASTGESALTLSWTAGASNGTTITSTRSILYGNVSARIKAVSGQDLVTSFALLSGAEDEVDFEFTTNMTDVTNTAFYYQGAEVQLADEGQELNATNRSTDFHDYTISWLPETITWLVDGVAIRNVSKNSTLDGETYKFPQTPARIRFSIWKGGELATSVSEFDFNGALDVNSTAPQEQDYAASYVSAVNVLCYPTSLLANFAVHGPAHSANNPSSSPIETNSTASALLPSNETSVADTSVVPNATDLSLDVGDTASPTSSPGATASLVTSELNPSSESIASASQTLWWTAPSVASPAIEAQVPAVPTEASAPLWNAPALLRLRRRIHLDRVKRDEQAPSAYSYGSIDKNGQLGVDGYSGETRIASDLATGLNMMATVPSSPDEDGSEKPSSPVAAGEAKAADEGESEKDGKSRMEKWNDLPTWAHVLIIGGSAVVGLLIVIVIGRCFWRKASGSSAPPQQSYAPIGDQGDFYEKAATPMTPYVSSNGTAYDPAPQAAATPSPLQRSSTASTASYTNGGYVPSSSLRNPYFPPGSSNGNHV